MEFLKRIFGLSSQPGYAPSHRPARRAMTPDEQAVERYRYLLQTAPPETIEAAHVEAFARLTDAQRQLVLQELNQTMTPAERTTDMARFDDPRSLARLATRAELRAPGTLERTWSGMPGMGGAGMGGGMGGLMMGNFMSTMSGMFVGSMIADAFLGNSGYDQGYADGADAGGADAGGGDFVDGGGGDFGGGFGGGDLGGGDFGGFGDFGGGDF